MKLTIDERNTVASNLKKQGKTIICFVREAFLQDQLGFPKDCFTQFYTAFQNWFYHGTEAHSEGFYKIVKGLL